MTSENLNLVKGKSNCEMMPATNIKTVRRKSSYSFDIDEITKMRSELLNWYKKSKRDMPWRTVAIGSTNKQQHAYAVWVSEVMLQQTRVATVIDYYNR